MVDWVGVKGLGFGGNLSSSTPAELTTFSRKRSTHTAAVYEPKRTRPKRWLIWVGVEGLRFGGNRSSSTPVELTTYTRKRAEDDYPIQWVP